MRAVKLHSRQQVTSDGGRQGDDERYASQPLANINLRLPVLIYRSSTDWVPVIFCTGIVRRVNIVCLDPAGDPSTGHGIVPSQRTSWQ